MFTARSFLLSRRVALPPVVSGPVIGAIRSVRARASDKPPSEPPSQPRSSAPVHEKIHHHMTDEVGVKMNAAGLIALTAGSHVWCRPLRVQC